MTSDTNLTLLLTKTAARLAEIAGRTSGVLGLSVLDLTTREQFGVNEHCLFPQASAIKIPVLMEVYKQAGEGNFKLTDLRRIQKQDKTGGSGILTELGDGTVQMTLHDLCILMIVLSDNTATNILIDQVGIAAVNETLRSLGLKQTRLQRRMMDTTAALRGDENLSTPAEAARIMEIIWRGEFISRSVCDEILAILKKPKAGTFSNALPADTEIASKPGGLPGVTTEWAIVLLKDRPYAVAIMENYAVKPDASEALSTIPKIIHGYFNRLRLATPFGWYVNPPAPDPGREPGI
jgi:beta-lactamase class A